MNKLAIGRIVILKLSSYQKEELRVAAHLRGEKQPNPNNGADEAPAIVVRAWSDTCANLNVLCDGKDTLWVTSAVEGDGEGQWHWPVRS